ncbi:MAG TPA: tRNA (adenosine(37)-N6)-threonylcarbamoyltransferase complex ATPase subunit type 1 TsaE, partial [Pyrinomonadaceae bacterium]|nr:tRNA (adenosine(37)-N6)-threonylcarbamoyltransferase complex ATPase subunit type 1 TsaE [Pyrinomonadaceae bacterium]
MSTHATTGLPTGRWTSNAPEETFELGAHTGAHLRGGEVLLLDGPLGAGKTIFAKGIARALGIDTDEVTSPSFTLVNIY